MLIKTRYKNLGLIDYKEAWDFQENIFKQIFEKKQNPNSTIKAENYFIVCQHPHVYTLGKSGDKANLLITEDFLKKIDAQFYKINRGGDITYHGPGQIVGYPILDLEEFNLGIKKYIYTLEQVIIDTLAAFEIKTRRKEKATGVWLGEADTPNEKKICAIGVRASRYISMHGFALNVNTDLSYFNYINPCGFTDKQATSMQEILGRKIEEQEVVAKICENFEKIYKTALLNTSSLNEE
ncbi:MAG: lipoate--protein ligase [Bacteroidia bacterium]|nr:MAG: lipoate--protein ligase [Bacteroidia bacterium]